MLARALYGATVDDIRKSSRQGDAEGGAGFDSRPFIHLPMLGDEREEMEMINQIKNLIDLYENGVITPLEVVMQINSLAASRELDSYDRIILRLILAGIESRMEGVFERVSF